MPLPAIIGHDISAVIEEVVSHVTEFRAGDAVHCTPRIFGGPRSCAAPLHGMTDPERAMLYELAAQTGLRLSELRSLTRGSFSLRGDSPTVTVEAGYSKRRRRDELPLRPDTARGLEMFFGAKMPRALAFKMPPHCRGARMLKADLAATRALWISQASSVAERIERERSDYLAAIDHAGKVLDFHGLRHTFISNLAAAGVHPKTAQSLARHSTITLTMDRYSHVLRGAEQSTLALLPDPDSLPDSERLRATGTHHATPREVQNVGRAKPDSAGYSVDGSGRQSPLSGGG